MADNITLKIDVDGKESIKTLGDMEKSLTSMKEEIRGLDTSSKEFKKLSNQIRSTESDVKNINKSFEGLDTEALTGEFGKLAGGITSAMTGIGVLGDSANESMEAMIATVGKGMAIAQGFKGATEAMTAAQRVYNAVLKANPIGLIVTAIGLFIAAVVALISNGDKIIDMLDGWAEKFTFLQGPINVVKAGIQGLMDLWEKAQRFFLGDDAVDEMLAEKADKIRTEESIKSKDWETKRLEAIKASEEDIYNAKKKALEDRLHLAELNGEQETDEYKQLQIDLLAVETNHTAALKKEKDKQLADEKEKNDKILEFKKRLDEQLKEQVEKTIDEKKSIEIDGEIEIADEKDNQADKDRERQMASVDLAKDIWFKTEEGQRLHLEQMEADLLEARELGLISKEEYEASLDEVNKNRRTKELQDKKDLEDEKLEMVLYGLEQAGNAIDIYSQILDNQMNKELKAAEGNEKKQEQIRKEYGEKKKNAAILSAIIDTAMGVITAIAQNPPPSPIGIISGAIVAAAGAVQIATISQQQFADGGILQGPSHKQGGISTPFGELEGGEGVINAASMSNASLRNMASIANTAGGGKDFSTGDGSIKLSNESIAMIVGGFNDKRVYVSETDITSTQNRVKVTEEMSVL